MTALNCLVLSAAHGLSLLVHFHRRVCPDVISLRSFGVSFLSISHAPASCEALDGARRYFESHWNKLDFLVVMEGVFGLILVSAIISARLLSFQ